MVVTRPPELQEQWEERHRRRIRRIEEKLGPDYIIDIPATRRSPAKRLSLGEAQANVLLYFEHLLTKEELRQKLSKQKELFDLLLDIQKRREKKQTYEEIGAALKKHKTTIAQYHKGERLPVGLMLGPWGHGPAKMRRDIDLGEILESPEKREMMGYLVGAGFGNMPTLRGGRSAVANTAFASKDFAEEIARCGKELFGFQGDVNPYVNQRGKTYHYLALGPMDFVQFFNRVTDSGKRVPTKFLGKMGQEHRAEVRRGFVKGLVDSHAFVTGRDNTIQIQISDKKVRWYFIRALGEMGIRATYSKNSRKLHILAGLDNLERFKEQVGFRDKEYAQRLDEAVETRRTRLEAETAKKEARRTAIAQIARRGREFTTIKEMVQAANELLPEEHKLKTRTSPQARRDFKGMLSRFPKVKALRR